MGLISRTSFSLGDIPSTSEWNTQFDTAYNEINGNLDSDNILINSINDDRLTESYLNLSSSTTATANGSYTFSNLLKFGDANSNVVAYKVIDIGDWNMDTTTSVNVAHGLTLANIRSVDVVIRNDTDSAYYQLNRTPSGNNDGTIDSIDSTNVGLARDTGGIFDSTSFDSTSYNRGWITIIYTV